MQCDPAEWVIRKFNDRSTEPLDFDAWALFDLHGCAESASGAQCSSAFAFLKLNAADEL